MKVPFLFLVGFSLAASILGAQETPTRIEQEDQDQVTALVRAALAEPDAPASWAGLAQGLSSLEGKLPLGATGLREAVRVADSLAFSPTLAAGSSSDSGGAGSFLASLLREVRSVTSRIIQGPLSLLSFLGFLVGSWFVVSRVSRVLKPRQRAREFVALIRGVSRAAGGRARRSGRREKPGKTSNDPRALALALCEHGLPANEVARQTGLAQDEVAVVLALRGRSGTFAPGSGGPSRRSA